MVIAVIGSRTFNNYPKLERELDLIINSLSDEDRKDITIISGGASGADTWAEVYATYKKYKLEVYEADWNTHGKKAGYLRNVKMLEACDKVVAFWDGKSKGTKLSVDYALSHKIPLQIVGV